VDQWLNRARYGHDRVGNDNWDRGWDGRDGWNRYWNRRFVYSAYQPWYSGNWYGAWPNRWNQWDQPFSYGLLGWGFNSLGFRGGYYRYSNPYYVGGYFAPGVDYYSTPIVVETYDPDDTEVADAGIAEFEHARQEFKIGNYQAALEWTERALMERSHDPVIHEFRALCLFAVGEYRKAGVVLNSLLATAPGWDWKTMVNLYPSDGAYEVQLRALERFRNDHPADASARFVLAYHYLVMGSVEAGQKELRKVVELEPNDLVAARILRGLNGESEVDPAPIAEPPAVAQGDLEADLVGTWSANRDDGSSFQFVISEDGAFRWNVKDPSGREESIEGRLTIAEDVLILQGAEGGTMVGRVRAEDGNRFTFTLIGSEDEGLSFVRTS
jgi:tetratricopeptide (TPR) repeat protein